jgi:hypothetical protein
MAKPTKEVLIRMLVKDLIRREPDMASHPADARYRVSHWGGAGPCTLRDLALKARNAELITDEEYSRAAPDAGYGSKHWHKMEKVAENRRHRAASPERVFYGTQSPSPVLPPGTKRG